MNLRSLSLAFLLALVAAGSSLVSAQETKTPARKVQRYAVLVGVNDYAPPLGKLEFCQNDMTELRTHLEAAGFAKENITYIHDKANNARLTPTKSNIEGTLRLNLQLANEDDIVLVAFSGHGVHLDGKSFLCPSDARLDATDTLVSIDDLYAQLEKCKASQKLLLVDACRNEPIVRGFKSGKLADDLAVQVQSPPRGLIVLSSCEVGQFSAEDAKLHHGVFMNYIIQGLKGAADTDADIGGNNNGKISLDELYFFAHEKTKRHVAQSHGIVQRPVMKGEIIGRFDVAMVPDSAKLRELINREAKNETAKEKGKTGETADATKSANTTPKTVDHPLLRQGDKFLQQADYESAIKAYTAVIDNTSLDNDIRTEARKSRGASFLARGKKSDIKDALIDQTNAGLPGIQMTVRAATADLKDGKTVTGKVKQNQSLLITLVDGDWLYVKSVDGSDKLKGFINQSAVLTQPVVIPQDPIVRDTTGGNFPNNGGNGGGFPNNGGNNPRPRPGTGNGGGNGNGGESLAEQLLRRELEKQARKLLDKQNGNKGGGGFGGGNNGGNNGGNKNNGGFGGLGGLGGFKF